MRFLEPAEEDDELENRTRQRRSFDEGIAFLHSPGASLVVLEASFFLLLLLLLLLLRCQLLFLNGCLFFTTGRRTVFPFGDAVASKGALVVERIERRRTGGFCARHRTRPQALVATRASEIVGHT
jgi:hypothetical protein